MAVIVMREADAEREHECEAEGRAMERYGCEQHDERRWAGQQPARDSHGEQRAHREVVMVVM